MSGNRHELCLTLWAMDVFNQVWEEYQQNSNADQIPLDIDEIQSKFLEYVQNEFLVLAQSFIQEKLSTVSKGPSAVAVTTTTSQSEDVRVSEEDDEELLALDLSSAAAAAKQNQTESAVFPGRFSPVSPYPEHKCDFCNQYFDEYDEKVAHIRTHGRKSVLVMRDPPSQPEAEPEPEAELEPEPMHVYGESETPRGEFAECEFDMEIAEEVEVTTSPSNPLSESSDSSGEKSDSDDSDEVEVLEVVINRRDNEMSSESEEGYSSVEKDCDGKKEKLHNFGKNAENTESLSQNHCLVDTSLDFLEMPGFEIVTDAPPLTIQEKQNGSKKRKRCGAKPKKKFKCTDCSKICTSQSQLTLHFRVHSGEKPYACDLCGKRFSQKGNAEAHKSVHTKEKQYGCESCPKRFKHKLSLTNHQLKKHVYDDPN